MKLFLDQFEQQIDETILKRGLSYFQKGHVTDMEETGNGQYEFTVEGSDTYTVPQKGFDRRVKQYIICILSQ